MIIITELLICLKFDWDTFTKPPPTSVIVCWTVSLSILGLWTVWHFYLQRLFIHTEAKLNGQSDDAHNSPATVDKHKGNDVTPVKKLVARTSETEAIKMRLRSTPGSDNVS